jgi:hypothetical protein
LEGFKKSKISELSEMGIATRQLSQFHDIFAAASLK